ncbi:MAG: hypothetical protein JNK46_15340 [Methylobacteriaceae bacterium]|nr:hypothetical protein [Methylobacteriaceae bacterium]
MDQTDVGLKSVVKALTDTVAGAIDPADHLAREQLKLAASYVDFVRQRLHLIHARERYDLTHYIALARALLAIGLPEASPAVAAMRAALGEAEPLARDPAALTGRIRLVAMELAHAVAGVVQDAHRTQSGVAPQIDRAVIAASEEKLEMERLWYRPIGFDPSPDVGARLEDYFK